MTFWTLSRVVLSLLIAGTATAQTAAPQSASAGTAQLPAGVVPVTSVEGITEYRLPNGLQMLLAPDDSKPTTTVNVTYRVGSRHEHYGETGMAHLLEHLLFKGTPTTQNLLAEFTKRGFRANGTTSFDRTNYFASFAANDENLRWYLGWQADAMLNSLIARKDLDTEMTVVRNELEMGENNPTRVTVQQTLSAMFRWHNYGKATIGARADVENVSIPRLQAFYRQYYQPDNATLIVAGKFDVAKTLGWIAQSFGPLPKPTRELVKTYTIEAAQDGERSVTIRRVGGSPLVLAGYHVPAASDPDYAVFEALETILGDASAGRLFKQLVEKKLAASVFANSWDLAEPGVLMVGAVLAPEQDLAAAREALTAATESLGSEPITQAELERAKLQWIKGWERGFADPESVGVSLSTAISHGDWRLYFLVRDRIKALTLEQVQRVATQYLVRDNRTLASYVPTDAPRRAPTPVFVDVVAQLKDFKGAAAVAQAEAFDPTPANLEARTQRFALASGLKVALLPKGTRGNVVHAQLRLHYGDEKSLFDQETVASVVGGLLNKGSVGLSRQALRDRLDELGAQVSFSANGQTAFVGITTKREQLPSVIELVGKVLREPLFTSDALDELRSQMLAGIEQQRKEPGALIQLAVARHGNPYPRGDLRYAEDFDESVQDIKAVTPEALRAFHRRFYSAAHAEFGAAGDFDAPAVRAALTKAFGDWSAPAAGPTPYVRVPQPLVSVQPKRFLIRTPDKANANFAAHLALPLNDTHPDYPALTVANRLLGGDPASRLWKRLRDKEGFSYDVRTGIDWAWRELNSDWRASAILAPQNQAAFESALLDETERALKDGFTQAELDALRTSFLSLRRQSRAQDAGLAAQLAAQLDRSRDFAFEQRIDDAIAALTLDQVNTAMRTYIRPERWVSAFGGDFKP